MQTDLKERFIRASLWSGAATYLFFIFNFLCQWIFSRLLTPTDIGIFAFGCAVREIIGVVCIIAMPGGYIKSKGEQSDFDAYMMLTFVAAFAQMLISIILSLYYLFDEHNIQIAIVIILLGISQCLIILGYVYMATLEKKLEYKSIAVTQGIANLAAGFVAIFLAYYFHTIFALVTRDILSAAILLYLIYKKTKIRFYFKWNTVLLKEQFIFGVKCALARISEVSYYRIPELLISFLISKVALGYFYQARYLAYFPIKLFQPFTNSVLFSYFAHHKDEPRQLENQFWWISYIAIRLLLPLSGLIYIFGAQFLVFLYGQKWLVAGECFTYFSIFILSGVLFSIVTNMANLLGKQSYIIQAYLIALTLFLAGACRFDNVIDFAFMFSGTALVVVGFVTFRLFTQEAFANMFSLYYPIAILFSIFLISHHLQFSAWPNLELLAISLIIIYSVEYRHMSKLIKQIMLTRKIYL